MTIEATPRTPVREDDARADDARADDSPAEDARAEKWTVAARALFLAELGRSCNVAAAARAAGLSEGGAYSLRARSAAFRAEWAAALKDGYQMLETKLLARALSAADGEGAARSPAEKQADSVALRLLAAHRPAATGVTAPAASRRPGRPVREIVMARYAAVLAKTRGGRT